MTAQPSGSKTGVWERLRQKRRVRKERVVERARIKGELRRDRRALDRKASGRKSFEGGGG
jgi:hypothetical protein